MARKFFSLTIALASLAVFAVALTAPAAAQSLSANEKLYAKLAKLPAKERHARIVAGAKKEGEFEYVNTLSRSIIRGLKKKFTKKYPFLKLKFTNKGSQDATEQLFSEEKAGRHLTDAIGIGVPDYTALAGSNIAAAYPTPAIKSIKSEFKGFIDPKNELLPFYWSSHGITYNTKLVKNPPKSWMDLCHARFKGKASFEPAETRFLIGLYNLFGKDFNKVEAWIQCMAKNKPVIQRGHTARLRLMLSGDHAISADQYLYRGFSMKKKKKSLPFGIAENVPVLGYAGAVVINKNAPHPYAAALWADFLLTKSAQKVMAKKSRGTLTLPTKYLPKGAKLAIYGYADKKTADKLHKIWGKHIASR